MTSDLKEFIEKNIDLIESQDFTELYNDALASSGMLVSALSDALYTCGIDPVSKLTVLPPGFRKRSSLSIQDLVVPGNIRTIMQEAFMMTDVQEVHIEEGVVAINDRAFWSCPDLLFVHLPKSIQFLGSALFSNCPLATIFYAGTKEEWSQVGKPPTWLTLTRHTFVTVQCTDGRIQER